MAEETKRCQVRFNNFDGVVVQCVNEGTQRPEGRCCDYHQELEIAMRGQREKENVARRKAAAVAEAKDAVVECAQKLFIPPLFKPSSVKALGIALRHLKALGWEPGR